MLGVGTSCSLLELAKGAMGRSTLGDRAARVKACGRKRQEARWLQQREQMGGQGERR